MGMSTRRRTRSGRTAGASAEPAVVPKTRLDTKLVRLRVVKPPRSATPHPPPTDALTDRQARPGQPCGALIGGGTGPAAPRAGGEALRGGLPAPRAIGGLLGGGGDPAVEHDLARRH